MEYLLPYLCMVTVPHIMVRLERMSDYRGVGLARFHCTYVHTYLHICLSVNDTVYTYILRTYVCTYITSYYVVCCMGNFKGKNSAHNRDVCTLP